MNIAKSKWNTPDCRAERRSVLSGDGAALRAAFAVALVGMLLCGCGKIPSTRYYTFKFPALAPATDSKTNLVLEIEPFRASDNLRDDRVLYFESPTQFSYYEYHRWSPDPAAVVAEMTKRRVQEMAVFAHVRSSPTHEPADFLLRGRLLNFEELDYAPGGKVRVALELRLVRASDHKTAWSDRREVERSIDEKGVDGVVNALSAATDQLLSQALPGLGAEVEREFKERAEKPK